MDRKHTQTVNGIKQNVNGSQTDNERIMNRNRTERAGPFCRTYKKWEVLGGTYHSYCLKDESQAWSITCDVILWSLFFLHAGVFFR